MELGNLAFGNSRGEFSVPRGGGWEEELARLFDAYAPGRDNSWREYGEEFENDVFWIMPYWWGDCNCGWDAVDDHHRKVEGLEHSLDCYRHEWRKIRAATEDLPPGTWHDGQLKLLEPIYQKRGWDTESEDWWHGCATRCSCDYYERLNAIYQEYAQGFGFLGHKPDCGLVKDNFHYKPSGFGLQWYKYLLRDSFMNQNITLEDFARIIDGCIASLKE